MDELLDGKYTDARLHHQWAITDKTFSESVRDGGTENPDSPQMQEKLRNKLWSRLIKKGSSADEPASIDLRLDEIPRGPPHSFLYITK